jgi:TonB family protein
VAALVVFGLLSLLDRGAAVKPGEVKRRQGPETLTYSMAILPAADGEVARDAPIWPIEDATAAPDDSAGHQGGERPEGDGASGASAPVPQGNVVASVIPAAPGSAPAARQARTSSTRSATFSTQARSVTPAGSRQQGARRRTSVAVAMEEEKTAKATGPRERVIVQKAQETSKPKPAYPKAAEKESKQGFVKVKFKVSTLGTVEDIEILAAEPPGYFEESVREALKQWRYRPARDQDGKPIESAKQWSYQFKLVH